MFSCARTSHLWRLRGFKMLMFAVEHSGKLSVSSILDPSLANRNRENLLSDNFARLNSKSGLPRKLEHLGSKMMSNMTLKIQA
jgi:hypothetical protein